LRKETTGVFASVYVSTCDESDALVSLSEFLVSCPVSL